MQKRKTPDWNKVRVFLEVARQGTISSAGETLGLAPSSVARQLEDLEQQLGTVLFERSPRGYGLTDIGKSLVASAQAAEGAINAFARLGNTIGDEVSGTVRIAVPETIASDILIPALPRLSHRHPALKVEITTGVRTASLSRREADLALRLVRPDAATFILSRVATMETGLYASQAYLGPRAAQTGDSPVDVIGWDEAFQDLEAAGLLKRQFPRARTVLTATSLPAQLAAIKAGYGVGAVPCFMADGLTRVGDSRIFQPIYLVLHKDGKRSRRIAETSRFVRETMMAARDRLGPTAQERG